MNLNGMFNGRALKITADTLLEEFRRKFGGSGPGGGAGAFNFAVEFQLTAQTDEGSFASAEQQLNSLLGIARCLNDQQNYQVTLGIHVVSKAEQEMVSEAQRKSEAQLSVIAQPEKSLVLPTGKIGSRG